MARLGLAAGGCPLSKRPRILTGEEPDGVAAMDAADIEEIANSVADTIAGGVILICIGIKIVLDHFL